MRQAAASQPEDDRVTRALRAEKASRWRFRKCYPKVVDVVRRRLTSAEMRAILDSMGFADTYSHFDSTLFEDAVWMSLEANRDHVDFLNDDALMTFLVQAAEQSLKDEFQRRARASRDHMGIRTPELETRRVDSRREGVRAGARIVPVDRLQAESAISSMYGAIGHAPPRFVWCASPPAALRLMSRVGRRFRVCYVKPPNLCGLNWPSDPLVAMLGDSKRLAGELLKARSDARGLSQAGSSRTPWTRDLRNALVERLWDGDSLGMEMRNALREGCGVRFSDHQPDPVPAFGSSDDDHDFWWWPNRGVCFVCERPWEVHMLGGRLHNDSGPAVRFRDGWSVWAIGGVRVDELAVLYPELQSLQQIRGESNAEVKRVRIERFGWLRHLSEAGAVVVNRRRNDIEGTQETLFRGPDREKVLVCACPSTARVYALQVPPMIRTCAHAQEWLTGGLSGRIINGA